MTYRSNLSEFVKNRCIKALRAAIDDDGPVEDSIAERLVDDVLRSHAVRERVKLASANESNELARDLTEFVRELTEVGLKGVGLAPPSAVMPKEPDKMGDRPSLFNGVRHAKAARAFREADEALKKSAGDAVPPLQSDLAAWVGHCPHYVLTEAEKRLALMWGLEPKQVRVTGWAFGGLITWRDGVEFHAPAAELVETAQRWKIPNPLVPLVRACPTPVDGEANLRPDRILSAKLAMVDPSHRRAGRLFRSAAHRRGQLVLPGFEYEHEGPALPLALYQLGEDNLQRGGGPAAPLALRLFVEAVLAAPYEERNAGQPVVLQVTLRDLLDRLYPSPRRPKPSEYWPRLMSAVEAMDSMDARIPWHDPETGRSGLRRVVSVGDIPHGAWRAGRHGTDDCRPASGFWPGAQSVPGARSVGGKVRSGLHRLAQSGLPMVRPRCHPPSGARWPLAPSPGPQAIPRAVRCRRGGHHSAAIGAGRTAQSGGRGLGGPAEARKRGRAPHRGRPCAPASAGRGTLARTRRPGAALDARMRPLAGMTAHEGASRALSRILGSRGRRTSSTRATVCSWPRRPAHVEGLGASWSTCPALTSICSRTIMVVSPCNHGR